VSGLLDRFRSHPLLAGAGKLHLYNGYANKKLRRSHKGLKSFKSKKYKFYYTALLVVS
jgi:hypothetical protein